MNLPMVDCRSLIEFCKAFEQQKNSLAMSDQRNNHNHSRNKKHSKSLNPLSHPFCDHSPFAAIDIFVFLLVLGALGVLTVPYFKFLFDEACEVFPEAFVLIGEVIYTAPFAYAIGLVVMFVSVILAWEVIHHKSRKCGNPYCKGLRKAVEFDIQLESEECVKYMPPLPAYGVRPLELGEDHKELEAELKRMAPLNGRTVLIFRAPCGCPRGRMEVWGPKKIRRIKKYYTCTNQTIYFVRAAAHQLREGRIEAFVGYLGDQFRKLHFSCFKSCRTQIMSSKGLLGFLQH